MKSYSKIIYKKLFIIKVISSDYRAYKPDVRLFEKAIEHSGYRPSEALYIGDEQIDVDGAKKTGLKCVFINRNNTEMKFQCYQPDYIINSISDLLGILHTS